MPKIDISKLETRIGSPNYPAAFKPACAGRHKTALGNAVGLYAVRREPDQARARRRDLDQATGTSRRTSSSTSSKASAC